MLSLEGLEGLRWYDNGQVALSGALLSLHRRLDRLFRELAAREGAVEHAFPAFLPAAELGKIDYLRSFPHLATFPVTLAAREENVARFAENLELDYRNLRLTELSPVRDILTPAACYHFYVHYQGRTLEAPLHVTTCAQCFRREAEYSPLERQWCFSMREVVCVGTADEVKAFLERCRGWIDQQVERLGLPVTWANATDPFFRPAKNPKYLAQKLDPVKSELLFDGRLSIGSTNFHRNYFGEAFRITRDGQEAFSGCVAFGVERWIAAIVRTFGADPSRWPRELGEGGEE